MTPKTNAVATTEPAQLAAFQPTPDNIDLLKKTLTSAGTNLTDSELALYLHRIKQTQLDPLSRQIYVMKDRDGKISFITSIDGYRLIAERTGKYDGQSRPDFEIDGAGRIISCTVGVYKKGASQPFYATVYMDEFRKSFGQWTKMPRHMLSKVAESHALRKSFPQELSNLYTQDEMGVDGTPPAGEHYEEPSRDINADLDREAPVERPGQKRMRLIADLKAAFASQGINDLADKRKYLQEHINKEMPTTDDEYEAVIASLTTVEKPQADVVLTSEEFDAIMEKGEGI